MSMLSQTRKWPVFVAALAPLWLTGCGTASTPQTSEELPGPPVAQPALPAAQPAPPVLQPAPPPPQPTPTPPQQPTATAPAAPGAEITSEIQDFTLEELVIRVGPSVRWTNQDRAGHTVTSGSEGNLTGIFDSDILSSGDAFSFVFNEEGTFPYFCRIHPNLDSMNSTITVVSGEEPAPQPPVGLATSTATDTPEPPPPPQATEVPASPTPSPMPIMTTPVAEAPTSTPTLPTSTPIPPTPSPVPPNSTPTPTAPTPTPTPEAVFSNIVDFTLENLTVSAGTTVMWVNQDRAPHTTTAGTSGNNRTGEWDSGNLRQDETFSFTFDEPGTFPYFCNLHSNMKATVTVEEAGGG